MTFIQLVTVIVKLIWTFSWGSPGAHINAIALAASPYGVSYFPDKVPFFLTELQYSFTMWEGLTFSWKSPFSWQSCSTVLLCERVSQKPFFLTDLVYAATCGCILGFRVFLTKTISILGRTAYSLGPRPSTLHVFNCAWAENIFNVSSPAQLKMRTLNARRGRPGTEASITCGARILCRWSCFWSCSVNSSILRSKMMWSVWNEQIATDNTGRNVFTLTLLSSRLFPNCSSTCASVNHAYTEG